MLGMLIPAMVPSAASGVDIGDDIPYSLMLYSGASQYLSRTFGAPSSATSWAFSLWIKRGELSASLNAIFGAAAQVFYMPITDTLITNNSGTVATSSNVFRDPTAHDHVCIISNGTTVKVYHNLVEVSSYTGTMASINSATAHFIGRDPVSAALYGDGLFSQIIFTDVAGKAPTDFARISADTGQPVNKTYTGTYGANGFKLEFANPSALGTDTSGNGNNWTTNGGITSANQYTDTPTNNFCVFNPLHLYSTYATQLAKGNLQVTTDATRQSYGALPLPNGAKSVAWAKIISSGGGTRLGIRRASNSSRYVGWTYSQGTGQVALDNVTQATYATATVNDVLRFEVDLNNNTLQIFKNNTSLGSPLTITNTDDWVFQQLEETASTGVVLWNFGATTSPDTPTTGFKTLCTANLPTPAIPDPTKHIYIVAVAKSGNTNFTLPWDATAYDTRFKIKIRNTTGSCAWIDGLRGYDKVLFSDTTAAEITNANYITVSGTTITLGSALPDGSYVIEAMKAGLVSARQTNTNGTITSMVSANQLAGFSIVLHTNPGVAATVGHGLIKPPEFSINRVRGRTENWRVFYGAANKYLLLNATNAETTDTAIWNNTLPTSTVSSIGAYFSNGDSIVSYCHHSVEGYSKFFGSTRNASADGTFDNCGIKPLSITTKAYTTTGNWVVIDDKRDTYNVCSNQLYLNAATAETVATTLDITATGTKYRTASDPNASQSYINMIYGYPTKFATAR